MRTMEELEELYQLLGRKNILVLCLIIIYFSFILTLIIEKIIIEIFSIIATNKRKTIYLICGSIVFSINKLLFRLPYSRIVDIVVLTILMVIVLKQKLQAAFIVSVVSSIISIISEFIFSAIYKVENVIFLMNNMIGDLYVDLYEILLSFIMIFILIGIYWIIKTFEIGKKIKLISNYMLTKKENVLFIIKSMACLNGVLVNDLKLLQNENEFNYIFALINMVVIMVYYLVDVSKSNKIKEYEVKIKSLIEYNKNLNDMYDDTKSFRHDFNNIIQVIGGYIYDENIEGLKQVHEKITNELGNTETIKELSPDIVDDPAVYCMLCNKYATAKKYNINMNIEIMCSIKDLKINILDFCRVLGILLDNAIEASKICDKKEIMIRFLKDEKHNRNLIIVENTYKNYDVDIDKMFDKSYTTKSETKSHGLGLWRVKKILEANDNLNLYSSKGSKFSQQLEIYNDVANYV